MKAYEQTLVGNQAEGSLQTAVETARMQVSVLEMKKEQVVHDEEELKRQLMEAQLKDQQRETKEQEGKRTKEQIDRLAEAA